MFDKLKEISQLEKVKINDINKIIEISRGDLRMAINSLQKYNSISCDITLDELVNQIINIKNLILKSKLISDENKCQIIIKLMDIDQNLIKGCDEYIQFLKLGYYISNF